MYNQIPLEPGTVVQIAEEGTGTRLRQGTIINRSSGVPYQYIVVPTDQGEPLQITGRQIIGTITRRLFEIGEFITWGKADNLYLRGKVVARYNDIYVVDAYMSDKRVEVSKHDVWGLTLTYDATPSVAPDTPSTPPVDSAKQCLEQALAIVTGARRQAYGTPEDNFGCIAGLWSRFLQRRLGIPMHNQDGGPLIESQDVATMMILMKAARLAETPDHADSWRDIAGYAACGARASGADLTKGI